MSSTPFAKSLINGIVVALFVDSMTLLLFVSGPIINPNPGNVTEYWLMLGTTFALTNMWFVFVFLFYLNRVASTNVGLERNRKTVWAIMLTFFVFSALNLLGCVITAVWRVYEYSKCSGLEDEHPCNQNPSYRISFVQLICNAILVVTSIIQTFISGYLALVNLRTSGGRTSSDVPLEEVQYAKSRADPPPRMSYGGTHYRSSKGYEMNDGPPPGEHYGGAPMQSNHHANVPSQPSSVHF